MGRAKKNVDEDVEDDIEDSEETESTGGGGAVKRKRAPKKAAAPKGGKSSGKGSKAKKSKAPPSDEEEEEPDDDEDEEDDANDAAMKDVPKYYHSGNFVLLKSDVKWDGDKITNSLKDFNIWKIDAKVLLQKYVPLEANGQVLHKCTSAYSGWDVDNRENYYPISEILDMNPKTDSKETCVALNLDDVIKVRDKK